MTGRWALVRMKPRPKERGTNWLLIKDKDGHARPGSGDALVREHATSVASGRTIEALQAPRVRRPRRARARSRPRRRRRSVRAGARPGARGSAASAAAPIRPSWPRSFAPCRTARRPAPDGSTRPSSTATASRPACGAAPPGCSPATGTTGPAASRRPRRRCPDCPTPRSTANSWRWTRTATPTSRPSRRPSTRAARGRCASTPSTCWHARGRTCAASRSPNARRRSGRCWRSRRPAPCTWSTSRRRATPCCSRPAASAWRASSPSGSARPTAPGARATGSRRSAGAATSSWWAATPPGRGAP